MEDKRMKIPDWLLIPILGMGPVFLMAGINSEGIGNISVFLGGILALSFGLIALFKKLSN